MYEPNFSEGFISLGSRSSSGREWPKTAEKMTFQIVMRHMKLESEGNGVVVEKEKQDTMKKKVYMVCYVKMARACPLYLSLYTSSSRLQ